MNTAGNLANFDAAIAWEDRPEGGFIPSRAEVIGMGHVRSTCADGVVTALPNPVVFDERFTFTHIVRSGSGTFLLAR